MRVMLAMSGGVDSSVCGHLLLKQGYHVEGVTFDIGVTSREKFAKDVEDAKSVAKALSIPHKVVSFREMFKEQVVDPFVEGYKHGKTPNPCVICNRVLKFGALLEYAMNQGYDKLATGHYAAVREVDGKMYLAKAKDQRKDQTYFLYGVAHWDKVLFPLGDYTKDEIREIAKDLGLRVGDKKDSQEVCFIDKDYREFLESQNISLPPKGSFVDGTGRILGCHLGIHNYTIGQRKGLNIALGHRAYVTGVDPETNEVILGTEEALYKTLVKARLPQTLAHPILEDKVYEVKTRYKLTGDMAKVNYEDGCLYGHFDPPVRAPAPGQSMVVYDGDLVITGGEIVASSNG
ncbi:MAG: tRNA 2-thiouridine(34) synthase MnmA [Tissierellia bacterium]|nr:tRNA 2-thiouridine(34) synthase MnmA [Tissierellia bacterium]